MSHRILITGGTGFFGKSILDYFVRNNCDCEFTILSRHGVNAKTPPWVHFREMHRSGDDQNLPNGAFRGNAPTGEARSTGSVKQLLGDVRTFDLPPGTHYDWIIHAATPARADVPDDEMRSIIVDGTANALRQAKKCGAEKFMMVSSGGVYGKGFARPVSEDDEPHPFTAYGRAKLEAEKMAADSGLHVLLPRCFAFVGPYLDRNAHFAIGNFIRDALAGRDIVISGDGTPMRSYLHADDLVEWLFAILERGESGRVYNVGSPEAVSIRDLAATVLDVIRKRSGDEVDSGGNDPQSQISNFKFQIKQSLIPISNQTISNLKSNNPPSPISNQTIRVLGSPVPGAANYYVPNVDRIMSELGVRVKVGLREAIALAV